MMRQPSSAGGNVQKSPPSKGDLPARSRFGEGRERRLAYPILKGGPFVFNIPYDETPLPEPFLKVLPSLRKRLNICMKA